MSVSVFTGGFSVFQYFSVGFNNPSDFPRTLWSTIYFLTQESQITASVFVFFLKVSRMNERIKSCRLHIPTFLNVMQLSVFDKSCWAILWYASLNLSFYRVNIFRANYQWEKSELYSRLMCLFKPMIEYKKCMQMKTPDEGTDDCNGLWAVLLI